MHTTCITFSFQVLCVRCKHHDRDALRETWRNGWHCASFPQLGSLKGCFRPVSNRGPFACEANVITTTLRKLGLSGHYMSSRMAVYNPSLLQHFLPASGQVSSRVQLPQAHRACWHEQGRGFPHSVVSNHTLLHSDLLAVPSFTFPQ